MDYKYNYSKLVGKTISMRCPSHHDAYPFTESNLKVDIKVTADYEHYICAIVLPHYNPKGFDKSWPYPISIQKVDVEIGNVILGGVEYV